MFLGNLVPVDGLDELGNGFLALGRIQSGVIGHFFHDSKVRSHLLSHSGQQAEFRHQTNQLLHHLLAHGLLLGAVDQQGLVWIADFDPVLTIVVVQVCQGFALFVGEGIFGTGAKIDVVNFVALIVVPLIEKKMTYRYVFIRWEREQNKLKK